MERLDIQERERIVLRAVVQNHIKNPAPVGSKTLSRGSLYVLHLSPATIRNILADLDEKGYLSQPHTSAGRIPTEKGYRYYVDKLMAVKPLPPIHKKKVSLLIEKEIENTGRLMEDISRVLHALSRQTGLVLFPAVFETKIRKFHFIKVSAFNIQVILISTFSHVQNILIEVDEDWPENELTELENFLNSNYSCDTIKQIRHKLERKMKREQERYRKLRQRVLKIQEKIMEERPDAGLIVEGTSSLLDVHEFERDHKKIKKLLKMLSDKKKILKILDMCLEEDRVNINIGSELSSEGFEECSLAASSFHGENGFCGRIGVIGPTRMDYPYIVGLLDYICREISRRFSTQ